MLIAELDLERGAQGGGGIGVWRGLALSLVP